MVKILSHPRYHSELMRQFTACLFIPPVMLLQGIAVPPYGLPMATTDARMMLKHLTSCFGVKPQALLLPRQPGCGRVRLCELGSLRALLELMVAEAGHDISRHTEVRALVDLMALGGRHDTSRHTEVFIAHHPPKDAYMSRLRVSHRPATPCHAGFAARTFFPSYRLAGTTPNMISQSVEFWSRHHIC